MRVLYYENHDNHKPSEDVLTIERIAIGNAYVGYTLSGCSPPRFIMKRSELMDIERFIEESGLYSVLEVERYDVSG